MELLIEGSNWWAWVGGKNVDEETDAKMHYKLNSFLIRIRSFSIHLFFALHSLTNFSIFALDFVPVVFVIFHLF